MDDPRLEQILEHLDPSKGFRPWHGGPSTLGCLRGVTAEQAAWKPAPDRHSIWELTLHMAYWKYNVRRRITGGPPGGFPRSPADWPEVPDGAGESAWRRDRTLLGDVHTELSAAMEDFDPAHLDETPGGDGAHTYADLFQGILLHDTYHVGQIQIMKRIHRSLHGG